MPRLRPALAAVLLLASASATQAQTLRIAFKASMDGTDPHQSFTPNRNAQLHVWETLVTQDATLRPHPLLATSWRSVDPLTWEFTLRRDAVFHDGTPFTSTDAAFSILRAKAATGPRTYAAAVRNVATVETPDAHTLIVRTTVPTPLQPDFLVGIAMVSARAAEGAQDADFNGGRAAIGTGPYRWVRWTPQQDVTFERSPNWRGTPEPWERVQIRFIPNDSARVAALLAGDVDVIDTVPTGLHARISGNAATQLIKTDSVFTHYFYLDSMSDQVPNITGLDGQPLPQNPLRDLRVRQAISHALNREALANRVMEGGATATGQIAPVGLIGHVPEMPVPAYDPARSRALLAEAGDPQGFAMTIHCTQDRFAGDARTCQAIGQMLTAIGIRTTVEALPMPIYLRRSATLTPGGAPELTAHLSMFGSSSGIASEALTALIRTPNAARAHGGWNRTRYSNPQLDALLDRVDSEFDPAKREADTQEAIRWVADNLPLVPIFHVGASWGLRRGLTMTPRADQYTMATEVRAAP
ncbi:ABC transporter substrate-binding protein [Roseomonas sp. HJA6]|uniref:ABC transporter substrate-binding protein n=1 Tax=Roseomonas alba TaxID=2846776 RepID=A0ABS7A804_9PROT|nr:ABC transporter substrate-binding protein [Neoroseomonas alba]MBW6398431.1 ABC transporter substrate-binding protein [Neoroseomonas alba]